VAGHPIIIQPPPCPIWGGQTIPVDFGGGPATPKKPKNKKRKEKRVRGLGGGQTTPKGLATPDRPYGVVSITPYGRSGGGSAFEDGPATLFFFFLNIFCF
jgi:hypothetical protein